MLTSPDIQANEILQKRKLRDLDGHETPTPWLTQSTMLIQVDYAKSHISIVIPRATTKKKKKKKQKTKKKLYKEIYSKTL